MKHLIAAPLVESIYSSLKIRVARVQEKLNRPPKLAVVLVGKDPASVIYTNKKALVAKELGMLSETFRFEAGTPVTQVRALIETLNADPTVDGILIQRPLPKEFQERDIVHWIRPEKDVDAFHPINVGALQLGLPCHKPCTPSGVMRLLEFYRIPVTGKLVCVIGRSSIVGKPMATLLLLADATVIQCHRKTRQLHKLSAQADIVIAAAGVPGLIRAKHLKKQAIFVDVGIHRAKNGTLVGDVSTAAVLAKAKASTPVPGGVGPMTIAMLMENTVNSAETSFQ